MKGKLLKFVVGFTIAGVTGGGVYLFLRWKRKKDPEVDVALETEYFFDKKDADRMLRDEINKDPKHGGIDVKETIAELFRDKYTGGVMRDDDDPRSGDEHDISREKMARGVRGYEQSEEEKRNFEEYMAAMESPEEDDDEDLYSEEDDEDEDGQEMGIYPITAASFCNARNYYDKVSVSYFDEDDVLCDEKDRVMEEDERLRLGNLQEFIDELGDPSICYIRNEELEIDYEVSIVKGSYRREVLHEGE